VQVNFPKLFPSAISLDVKYVELTCLLTTLNLHSRHNQRLRNLGGIHPDHGPIPP
jgi:hypothetical protein